MIYITGDTHGEQVHFLSYRTTCLRNAQDILIVCGDWGFLMRDTEREHRFLDELEKQPWTFCFVDGNHENFPALFRFPEEVWNGGKVHRIRRNIFHLMRGQVFTIEDKTFFTFGGAYSIDRPYRTLNRSYWEEELPTPEEYHEAVRNLERYGNQVDYIITHTAPRELILRMGYIPHPRDAQLTGFLEYLMYHVKYRHWYCGHWHLEKDITERFSVLWYDVRTIDNREEASP